MRSVTLQLVAALTLYSVPEETQSLVGDLHPGDALCQEVRVDGGELASDVSVLEHGPQGGSQVSTGDISDVMQHCYLELDALCTGCGECLDHLCQHINISLPASQCMVPHEEEALGKAGGQIIDCSYLAWKDSGPVDHPHLNMPAGKVNEVGGHSQGMKVQQFATLLPPPYWLLSGQIFPYIICPTVVYVLCGEGWDGEITVQVEKGTILLPPPQV